MKYMNINNNETKKGVQMIFCNYKFNEVNKLHRERKRTLTKTWQPRDLVRTNMGWREKPNMLCRHIVSDAMNVAINRF